MSTDEIWVAWQRMVTRAHWSCRAMYTYIPPSADPPDAWVDLVCARSWGPEVHPPVAPGKYTATEEGVHIGTLEVLGYTTSPTGVGTYTCRWLGSRAPVGYTTSELAAMRIRSRSVGAP